jgi:hypothetical protein
MEPVDTGMQQPVQNKNKTKIIEKVYYLLLMIVVLLKPLGDQKSTLNFV